MSDNKTTTANTPNPMKSVPSNPPAVKPQTRNDGQKSSNYNKIEKR